MNETGRYTGLSLFGLALASAVICSCAKPLPKDSLRVEPRPFFPDGGKNTTDHQLTAGGRLAVKYQGSGRLIRITVWNCHQGSKTKIWGAGTTKADFRGEVSIMLRDVLKNSQANAYEMSLTGLLKGTFRIPKPPDETGFSAPLELPGTIVIAAGEGTAIWGYGKYVVGADGKAELRTEGETIDELAKKASWAVIVTLELEGK